MRYEEEAKVNQKLDALQALLKQYGWGLIPIYSDPLFRGTKQPIAYRFVKGDYSIYFDRRGWGHADLMWKKTSIENLMRVRERKNFTEDRKLSREEHAEIVLKLATDDFMTKAVIRHYKERIRSAEGDIKRAMSSMKDARRILVSFGVERP